MSTRSVNDMVAALGAESDLQVRGSRWAGLDKVVGRRSHPAGWTTRTTTVSGGNSARASHWRFGATDPFVLSAQHRARLRAQWADVSRPRRRALVWHHERRVLQVHGDVDARTIHVNGRHVPAADQFGLVPGERRRSSPRRSGGRRTHPETDRRSACRWLDLPSRTTPPVDGRAPCRSDRRLERALSPRHVSVTGDQVRLPHARAIGWSIVTRPPTT